MPVAKSRSTSARLRKERYSSSNRFRSFPCANTDGFLAVELFCLAWINKPRISDSLKDRGSCAIRPKLSFTRQKGDSLRRPFLTQYEQNTLRTTIFRRIDAGEYFFDRRSAAQFSINEGDSELKVNWRPA